MSSTHHDASDSDAGDSYSHAAARASTDLDSAYDYLLLSDVHLGSDIVPHSRPWATKSWLLEEAAIDAHLVAMLNHYRREREPLGPRAPEGALRQRPWCLVLAGDFVDLVGVSIGPDQTPLRTEPTRDERVYGLGSAADHVVRKMRAIADRHPGVFRALSEFVADGNRLVLVRGNHDVELHWHAAQRAFVHAVTRHAPAHAREAMRGRIEICPWFFVVDGLLYVEHGHEFDAMCSYGDPLMPTCTRDPRRIHATPFSVLLRQVARPTRGLRAAGYQYVGMGAYLDLLAQLGMRGSVEIAMRFSRASYLLLREAYTSLVASRTRRDRKARARHALFAARKGVRRTTLETLRTLYVAPATRSLPLVLKSLYLDRIFCSVLALAASGSAALAAAHANLVLATGLGVVAAIAGAYALHGSGSNTAPTERMRRSAAQIGALFGTRYVVMGHTHEPAFEEVAPGVRYVNLGSWGEDDPPDERVSHDQSPCTFLTLRFVHQDYQAQYMRWDPVRGPVPFALKPSSVDEERPGFAAAGPYTPARG